MEKKPKIAMILPDRIEHPVGGMGVQARYLIKHLGKDFDFTVHGFPDDTALPYYYGVSNPIPKIQHGSLNTLTCQAAYLASIVALPEKPDLIHVTDYTEYIAGYYAAQALGVPLVASMQLSAHLMNESGIWNSHEPTRPDGAAIENSFREMELLGLRAANRIIHVSSVYKKVFERIPGLDAKSAYIPNGVDLEEWDDFEKISLPGKARLKVVYLGRFAPQKNILALLGARMPEDIDMIYAGSRESGPKEIFAEIMRQAGSYPNVHYFGEVSGRLKVNLLRSADAVIIPSAHECHPIVMHEALASGNVVLSSGAGDMREVLPGDVAINCGISAESVARALEALARMPEEEIARRKSRGLEIVKNYTWAEAARKTAQVYREALSWKNRP